MAKIKLKSKLNKSANSNWEIVDDLPKAQNGLNTLTGRLGNTGLIGNITPGLHNNRQDSDADARPIPISNYNDFQRRNTLYNDSMQVYNNFANTHDMSDITNVANSTNLFPTQPVVFKRPKEQPINIQSSKPDLLKAYCPECEEWSKLIHKPGGASEVEVEQYNKLYPQYGNIETVPYKKGSYFTVPLSNKDRALSKDEVGAVEYFDKNTGRKLFQTGGEFKDPRTDSYYTPSSSESKLQEKVYNQNIQKQEDLRRIQSLQEKSRQKYKPNQYVKNTKAALSVGQLAQPLNLPLKAIATGADLETALMYGLDGQYKNAGEDLVQAGINWIPFLNQKEMINLSKNTPSLAYQFNQAIPTINKGINYLQKGNDVKTTTEAFKFGGNVNTDWEIMEEGGDVTQKGYKRNSPYVNNKQNIINSGRITMKGVDFPVHGVDEYGNEQMMFPNREYSFPGNQVTETRMKKNGGCLECEQKSLIKAQDGTTVDDKIQKFNELQRQISDIRNTRSKAVDKAKEVVKSGKYYELPKSALNFEQTQGKQEETCINGVCGVYNDIGVKFDQPGTVEGRFIGNGTFRNTNPKTGNPNYYDAGFRPIYNRDEMQVGDLVAWGKGHMQIMTDKDADGFKSFDNYNKAERAYKWGELSNPVVYGKNKTYREPLGFRYSKNENELQQQRDSLKKEIQKDNPHFLDNTFVPKYGDYKQLNTVNYTPTEGNTLSIKKSNAEKWLGSILPDQKKYMQDYNLSQSEFEKIAKLYSGILEQESDLGTSPRYFAKKIPLIQLFGKELTDVKDIYKGKKPTYSLPDMIFNENYSQGVGQIKPKWFKEDNKYGIDVDDPRAAFITLLDRYKNQVHGNKGTEEGYRQLVNAYKGIKSPNNEYLKNVFDYANKVNFNSDLVAPKFDYEGSKKKNQMPIRRGQYVESPIMANGGSISKWEIIN